jgi:cysteine synthase
MALSQGDTPCTSIWKISSAIPLVRLKRMPGDSSNIVLLKLEGNNPAGSVKDRPALSMIRRAEARGDIKPGDTLIEPTSGNTGIALAMAAAMMGYKMILLMPEGSSAERVQTMRAYGAEVILTPKGFHARSHRRGAPHAASRAGVILDQFANPDNPLAHYESTGPEIWADTQGGSPILFPAWALPAPSWATAVSSRKRTRLSRSSACSRKPAARFPVSANGKTNICPRSVISAVSIS